MKKAVILLIFIITLFVSCDKDYIREEEPIPEPKIEYYVKYEFRFGSYLNLAKKVRITMTGGKSYELKPSSDWWEGTFGPFKSCQNLCLQGNADQAYPNLNMRGRISISTGGPFILKAYKEEYTKSFNLNYRVTENDLK